MTLIITPQDREQLLANGRRRIAGEETDPRPVLKLFTPDAAATWLLTELDPEDPDLAFGLCDLGLGSPELGYVRVSEIASLRGAFGLPVARDGCFEPDRPISAYVREAVSMGRIVA